MFKKTQVASGVMIALGAVIAVTSAPVMAQGQTVEVTGSRIKRADAEGSLPVTVITRQELEASGSTTIAEFMRTSTFSSAGNFRPQSGSSAQSFAGIDLRGLGSNRTLVLIDGRRLPKAPNVGDSADLNIVPMAAIERVEILTDGASAIYGSDAIGGVVNIITRKDFEGLAVMAGYTDPEQAGGARAESSVLFGVNGDKGRMVAGVSRTERGMVYTRQRPWGQTLGVSSFGNNYFDPKRGYVALGNLKGDPKIGCTDPNFYLTASGSCSYNFNAVAADEAQIENSSIFARGEIKIAKDWTAYINSSVSRVESFGRYAPTPAGLTVKANTPNNPTNADIAVRHRTSAAGNRDSNTENNLYDFLIGAQGKVSANIDLDVGVRSTESKYLELGRNYIVRPILEQYVNAGTYNLYAPNANPADVLSAIKATIGRDSLFALKEAYATATFSNVFKAPGGNATLVVGTDQRKETYADIYDSLSEAGVIEGSAGNSAAGGRDVSSMTAELLVPISKQFEMSLAARYEKYSDYGDDLAPKIAFRFQPMKNLTLRASAGQGFGAPSLPILTQKESFSAESVFDPRTCIGFGGSGTGPAADNCNLGKLVQVDTYTGSNPSLKSEQSEQFSFGAVWDATQWLSLKADYFNISIDNKITLIGAQDLIDRSNGDDPRPIPAGLYVQRGVNGIITRVQQGYANEGTVSTDGIDLSAEARWKSAGNGNFRHELRYSHLLSYKDDGFDLVGALGLPEKRATLANGWNMGNLSASWNINYIGENGTSAARKAKEYVTHDVQVSWNTPLKGGKLIAGVVNLEGKMPQLVAYGGRNFNFYLYDGYGRQPYVRFEQKF